MSRRSDPVKRIRKLTENRRVGTLKEIILDEDELISSHKLAIDGLIEIDAAESWTAICEVLTADNSSMIELIIASLAENRSPGAVRALGEALRNPNPFVRSGAVRAFANDDSAASLVLLLRASRDPAPTIARIAGRAIVRRVEARPSVLTEVRMETAQGIVELLDVQWAMEMLSDSYPESMRIVAARRLGAIGGDEASCALASVIEATEGAVQDACWTALEACGAVTDHLLLPLLANSDPKRRARAITVYTKFAGQYATGMLTGFASDPAPVVRKAAIRCLVTLDAEGSLDLLRKGLEDEDEDVRSQVVTHLCQIPDTFPELVEVASKEKGRIRRKALIHLANNGIVTPELVMAYLELLFHGSSVTDLNDRETLDGLTAAAKALGTEQVPEGLLALTGLARSVVRRLRRVAIEAIMEYEPDLRSDALDSLMDSYDMDILKNVAFGLFDADDDRCMIPLIRTSLECKGRPMMKAKTILDHHPLARNLEYLTGCLKGRWASLRRFGATRLKGLKDPKSIPALLEASRDEDVEVQLAVFEALGPFAGEHEDVIERMLEAISIGDITVRQAACEALGEARCQRAVPELIKALHNYFLRPRATEAIRRIGDRKGFLALKRIERREKLFPKKPQTVVEQSRSRSAATKGGR